MIGNTEVNGAFKSQPIWGVVKQRKYMPNQIGVVKFAQVVANPENYYPAALLGRSLTHAEATAIAKMFNSGVSNGTD